MAKSTITARRRIMAIFPGRRPRWRNMNPSYLGRASASRKAVTMLRPLVAGADQLRTERNALHREDCDPTQYQRTAEHDHRFDDGEQRRARHRKLQPHDEIIVHQIKAKGIGGRTVEQPRMFGGEMQAD